MFGFFRKLRFRLRHGACHQGHACGHHRGWHRRHVMASMLAVAACGMAAQGFAHQPNGNGEGRGEHPGAQWFRAKIDAHVADALDLAKATPEQRKFVLAEVEALMAKGKAGMERHHRARQAAVDWLKSDRADPKAIQTLAEEFVAHHAERATELAGALQRIHGQFRPDQRKAIGGYVAELLPAQKGHWQERMMRFWADRATERAFDKIQATPDQRKALTALRDRVIDKFAATRDGRRADLDRALALWQADRWDDAQAKTLVDGQRQRGEEMAQFVTQQALELHKVLTPAQRAKLAEFVQNWHGRGPGGGPEGGRE